MDLTITNEALTYIKKRLPEAAYYLLTADDGSNQYSAGGGACSVGDTFQVVGVKELEAPYDIKMENSQDVPFYTSKNDTTFFEPGMKIDFKSNFLQLKNDGGMMDGQVTTKDATKNENAAGISGDIKGC